jgi:hypothetical protein
MSEWTPAGGAHAAPCIGAHILSLTSRVFETIGSWREKTWRISKLLHIFALSIMLSFKPIIDHKTTVGITVSSIQEWQHRFLHIPFVFRAYHASTDAAPNANGTIGNQ